MQTDEEEGNEVEEEAEDEEDEDEEDDEEEKNEEEFSGSEDDEELEDDMPKAQEITTNYPVADVIKKSAPLFIKFSDNGEKTLGQFIEYQLNLFKYRHYTFCYSIYVCFDMARLLYFDRRCLRLGAVQLG